MSDWRTVRLGDYSFLQGGFAFRSSDFQEEGTPLIRISNVSDGGISCQNLVFLPRNYIKDFSDFSGESGDILIAMSGATTGKTAIIKSGDLPLLINQRVGRFKITKFDEMDQDYLYFIVNTHDFQKEVLIDAIGGAQPNISPSKIHRYSFKLPSFQEQRKIARILTTVDTLIEKTETLIRKYESIKQGMMHDLFTRGVDETGRLRPTYEEAPHLYWKSELGWIPKGWDCLNIDDCIDKIEQGWSPDCGNTPALKGKWGVLKTTAVTWSGYNDFENKVLPEHLAPRPEYEVKPLDVLMTRGGPNSRVGVVSIVRETKDKLMMSDKLYRIVPNRKITPDYLSLALSSDKTQVHLSSFKTGLAESQTNISQQIVRRLLITLPSIDEQVVIGSIMYAVEKRLLFEKEGLEKFQSIKHGLMQDLLTGKVRVKVDDVLEDTDHV